MFSKTFSITLFATIALNACSNNSKKSTPPAPVPEPIPHSSPDVTPKNPPVTPSNSNGDGGPAQPTAQAPSTDPLLGTWKTPTEEGTSYGITLSQTDVTFSLTCASSGGDLTAHAQTTYHIIGGSLHIDESIDDSASNDEASCLLIIGKGDIPFQIDGNTLTLTLGSETRTYNRIETK